MSRKTRGYLKYYDYDIGVVFKKKTENQTKIYSKVYDLISQDVPDLINGPKLDISFLQKANPALQMTAVKYGKILMEIDPRFRADYEERVTKLYNDYLPLKREFEEATLTAFKD